MGSAAAAAVVVATVAGTEVTVAAAPMGGIRGELAD